jgi:hypothetical protein
MTSEMGCERTFYRRSVTSQFDPNATFDFPFEGSRIKSYYWSGAGPWAVLPCRAARGSTYRKATCGAALRLRLSGHAVQGCRPAHHLNQAPCRDSGSKDDVAPSIEVSTELFLGPRTLADGLHQQPMRTQGSYLHTHTLTWLAHLRTLIPRRPELSSQQTAQ